jgi:hypothetical protein
MVSLRFAPCQGIQKQASRARSTAESRFKHFFEEAAIDTAAKLLRITPNAIGVAQVNLRAIVVPSVV